jgi:hypothetical protein
MFVLLLCRPVILSSILFFKIKLQPSKHKPPFPRAQRLFSQTYILPFRLLGSIAFRDEYSGYFYHPGAHPSRRPIHLKRLAAAEGRKKLSKTSSFLTEKFEPSFQLNY